MEDQLRIAFIHPDLGIGGAEMLVINLAVALQNQGHYVKIYTPYHDPNHCFKETKDGTLKVEVRGSLFPRHIFGKFIAFCAYIRMILAALYIILYGGHYDCIIVDQVSVCVPILRLFRRKVLFYCHFPDKLLCTQRSNPLKRFYRFFLDFFEEVTLIPTNLILVNSKFTQGFFYASFPILKRLKKPTEVLYPAIDLGKFDNVNQGLSAKPQDEIKEPFFLSLNRYERKKNINLAVEAFAKFREKNGKIKCRLVIAGGHDPRIRENVEHKGELEELSKKLGGEGEVSFKVNVTDEERVYLLKNAVGLMYTPENEHFGIVPLEAQYMETPVLASNSGGPKETVIEGETGFLLSKKPEDWAEKMGVLLNEERRRKDMGRKGKENVLSKFSFNAFSQFTDEFVKRTIAGNKKEKKTK